MSTSAELAHLFRTLKASAAARVMPELAERALPRCWYVSASMISTSPTSASSTTARAACSLGLPASEAEDEHERLIDGTEFARVEASRGFAETLRVDDRRL